MSGGCLVDWPLPNLSYPINPSGSALNLLRRCNECKLPLSGKGGGQVHKELTGHQFQPMYACVACREAFNKRKRYRTHYCTGPKQASTMNLEPEVVESSLGPPVGGAENVGQSTSESLEKRCSQCKQPLSSKREGRRHEELTGHVWQPMYVCKACGDAFKKDKLFRGHQCRHTTSTDVVESPKASSQASVQVFCEQTPNLDHMERRCNQCKMPVSSRKKGRAHGQLTGHKSQPIYGCVVCGDAFRKETLYLEHQCSGQSVAHEPESHDTSDGLIGGVLGGTSAGRLEPEFDLPVTPHSEKNMEAERASLVQGSEESVAEERSPSTSLEEARQVLEELNLEQDRADDPNSQSICEAGDGPTAPVKAESKLYRSVPRWYCRSCLQEPCIEPVVTMCGHIFCFRCIICEIAKEFACPVCGKVFAVALDV